MGAHAEIKSEIAELDKLSERLAALTERHRITYEVERMKRPDAYDIIGSDGSRYTSSFDEVSETWDLFHVGGGCLMPDGFADAYAAARWLEERE